MQEKEKASQEIWNYNCICVSECQFDKETQNVPSVSTFQVYKALLFCGIELICNFQFSILSSSCQEVRSKFQNCCFRTSCWHQDWRGISEVKLWCKSFPFVSFKSNFILRLHICAIKINWHHCWFFFILNTSQVRSS